MMQKWIGLRPQENREMRKSVDSSPASSPEPATGPAAHLPALLGSPAVQVDDKGMLVRVNTAAETLFGLVAADMLGRDAHDLLHRDRHGHMLARVQCPLYEAFLGRRAQAGRGWFVAGREGLADLGWATVPRAGAAGASRGSVVVFWPWDEPVPHAAGPSGQSERMTELERLALLAETTTQLTSTLDSGEMLDRLAELVVPRLADWAVVDLITESDEVERVLVVHHENGRLVSRPDLQGPMPPVLTHSPMPLSRALRGAASSLAGPSVYQGAPDSGIAVEQQRLFAATGMHSAAIAPIRGLRDVLGALTLGRSEHSRPMDAADLSLLEDITRRTGLALDNARLYLRQRKVAETMQRHLLPQLPQIAGVEMAARYQAAPDASQVGGDWYDAFRLADGAVALAVGDVVGHDLDAAAGMAQLRSILRAYAWPGHEPPSAVLSRLARVAGHMAGVDLATLVYGVLEQSGDDGRWRLTWSNAGHPPPLLVSPDGQARFLTAGRGLLLSTGLDEPRDDATTPLPPGATLVLYTDGLVESRTAPIDDGLLRLRRHAAALVNRPLPVFADLLLQRVRPDPDTGDDDIALLCVRVPAGGG